MIKHLISAVGGEDKLLCSGLVPESELPRLRRNAVRVQGRENLVRSRLCAKCCRFLGMKSRELRTLWKLGEL